MFVCQCGAVNDSTIRGAIRCGAHTVDDVGDACGAGMQCGTCRPTIQRMIDEILGSHANGRVTVSVGPAGPVGWERR